MYSQCAFNGGSCMYNLSQYTYHHTCMPLQSSSAQETPRLDFIVNTPYKVLTQFFLPIPYLATAFVITVFSLITAQQ